MDSFLQSSKVAVSEFALLIIGCSERTPQNPAASRARGKINCSTSARKQLNTRDGDPTLTHPWTNATNKHDQWSVIDAKTCWNGPTIQGNGTMEACKGVDHTAASKFKVTSILNRCCCSGSSKIATHKCSRACSTLAAPSHIWACDLVTCKTQICK